MLRLLMRDEAQHIERLIARAGMDAARAGAILTGLELRRVGPPARRPTMDRSRRTVEGA